MKWPRLARPAPLPERDTDGIDEAHEALEEALSRWPEVTDVAERIRGIRRRNHLAEITEQALRGSR